MVITQDYHKLSASMLSCHSGTGIPFTKFIKIPVKQAELAVRCTLLPELK